MDTNFGPLLCLGVTGLCNTSNAGARIGVGLWNILCKDTITISDFPDEIFIWDKTILKNKFSIVG